MSTDYTWQSTHANILNVADKNKLKQGRGRKNNSFHYCTFINSQEVSQ